MSLLRKLKHRLFPKSKLVPPAHQVRQKVRPLQPQKKVKDKVSKKNWIAGAISKPGALHEQLHVPKGEKIPAKKLEKAAKSSGTLGKRARLAKTLKGLKKK